MREHVLLGLVDGLGDAGAAVLAESACHIGRIAGQKCRAEQRLLAVFFAQCVDRFVELRELFIVRRVGKTAYKIARPVLFQTAIKPFSLDRLNRKAFRKGRLFCAVKSKL